jgi:hypothetical protein
VVRVEWKFKERPDPVRTESELPRDGAGWLAECVQCGRTRTISRAEIMDGTWTVCPFCIASDEAEEEE